jgi:hypothetical protein
MLSPLSLLADIMDLILLVPTIIKAPDLEQNQSLKKHCTLFDAIVTGYPKLNDRTRRNTEKWKRMNIIFSCSGIESDTTWEGALLCPFSALGTIVLILITKI